MVFQDNLRSLEAVPCGLTSYRVGKSKLRLLRFVYCSIAESRTLGNLGVKSGERERERREEERKQEGVDYMMHLSMEENGTKIFLF